MNTELQHIEFREEKNKKKREKKEKTQLPDPSAVDFVFLSPSHPHRAGEHVTVSMNLNPRVLGSIIALSPFVVLLEEEAAAAAAENDPVSSFPKGTRG